MIKYNNKYRIYEKKRFEFNDHPSYMHEKVRTSVRAIYLINLRNGCCLIALFSYDDTAPGSTLPSHLSHSDII